MGNRAAKQVWQEPMPRRLGALFDMRAVLEVAGDTEAMHDLDLVIETATLATLAKQHLPPGTVTVVKQNYWLGSADRVAIRQELLDAAIAAHAHDGSAGDAVVSATRMRIDLENVSPLHVAQLDMEVRLDAEGSPHPTRLRCREAQPRKAAERWSSVCEASYEGAGDAAAPEARERLGKLAAAWQQGRATARTSVKRAAFTDLPEAGWVALEPAKVTVTVSKEKVDAIRELQRENACWNRGTCLSDAWRIAVNEHPFAVAGLVAGIAGVLLMIPTMFVRRARFPVGAALTLAAAVVAIGFPFLPGLGWGALFWPLIVVAALAFVVAVWVTAILGGARRPPGDESPQEPLP